MKKIILILFLFLLCLACYYIYKVTEDKQLDIVAIGDDIAYNPYLDNLNHDFVNKDYRINDLLSIINYNQELLVGGKTESIHKLLKNADILIISIGMNDIYYKLNDSSKEIYTYLNDIINKYNQILQKISKYDYQQVYILNYYNTSNKNNDIFTYINYKLNKITNNYNYTYIDLSKILSNRPQYHQNNHDFSLNSDGYYQIFKILVEKTKKT